MIIGLFVVLAGAFQPSQPFVEDDETAVMITQPADYSKQTTRHWIYLQDATATIQGSSNEL